MKIEYSKNIDALYIKLREANIADSWILRKELLLTLMKRATL
jgi:uncharacterized protein YuzE